MDCISCGGPPANVLQATDLCDTLPFDVQLAAPPDTPEGTHNALSPEHCPEAKRKAFQQTNNVPTKEYLKTKDQPVVTSGKETKKEQPGPVPKAEEFTESDQEARYYRVGFAQLVRFLFSRMFVLLYISGVAVRGMIF